MKIRVPGDSPMERLTNFAKRVVAVPKQEVIAKDKQWHAQKRKRKKRDA
jgi:hypothetical protein